MTDRAFQNALNERNRLAENLNGVLEQIAAYKAKIEACEREEVILREGIARVQQFISDWYVFSGETRPSDELDLLGSAPVVAGAPPPKPSRPRTNSKKEDVAAATIDILVKTRRPIARKDLLPLLRQRGFVIEGVDPDMVLSTMLWRMRDKVVRLKTGGYWLAGTPSPDGSYIPDNTLGPLPDRLREMEESQSNRVTANVLGGLEEYV